METIIVQRGRTTLDLLLWRRHGLAGRGLLSAAMALNPGIARFGAILPIGTSVKLPDLPAPSTTPRPSVSLFGDD